MATGSRFTPSRAQQKFLVAWLDADADAPRTVSGIATHIGIPRRTICGWLGNTAFTTWFNAQTRLHTANFVRPALAKLTELAMAGSLEHMRLLLEIHRGIREDPDDDPVPFRITFGLPRP